MRETYHVEVILNFIKSSIELVSKKKKKIIYRIVVSFIRSSMFLRKKKERKRSFMDFFFFGTCECGWFQPLTFLIYKFYVS